MSVVLLLHSAATLDNDLEDLEIDRSNHRTGMLLSGALSAEHARTLSYSLYILALLTTSLLPLRFGHLGFATAFLLLGWIYNRRPLQFSRRPIASIITLGACYGALPLAYGLWLGGSELIDPNSLGLIGIWFTGRIGVSILKDFKDARGDRAHHKRTFYLAYGRSHTIWLSLIAGLISYAAILASLPRSPHYLTPLGLWLGATCLTMLIGNLYLRWRLRPTASLADLSQRFVAIFYSHTGFEGTLALWLLYLSR
jgi:4-hydroxybenzoate polyprenyltransferase